MISPAELAAMQATATAAMDLTITISRAALARTALGGQSETFANVATVAGNLAQPTAGQLQNYDYLIGALSAWQVRVPAGTDVRPNDQLTVSGLAVPLRVQVILQPQSYQTATRLLATEIR